MSWHNGDWLGARARLSPERTALVLAETGETLSYRAWNERANRTARWLRARGIGKGDRVAVLAKNCLEYLDLWFACGKLGAVLQTLNWRLTGHELHAMLAPLPPQMLLHDAENLPTELSTVAAQVLPMSALDEAAALPAQPLPEVTVAADDPWVICYTGGSTGTPKGAILTHGSLFANAVNTLTSWQLDADDVAILNAPLFHVGGLSVLTAPLVLAGGCSIVCAGFDAGQVLDLVRTRGVTAFFGVPTMFLAILAEPSFARTQLDHLKLIISGGAPCPDSIFETMLAKGARFRQGYGLTEAGPNTFWLPDEQLQKKRGQVGYPLFGVDVRVVDEHGQQVAPGTPGELWIRGAHVFAGYLGNPEESARALEGGWLRTGDVAVVDADGAHAIVGRVKDVIISGGENVYPAEVEGQLSTHPQVCEVCVIGVADARWGEVPRALVVARGALQANELLDYARGRLARFKVPKDVVFVDELPRTGAGKVDRRAVSALHAGGTS